MRPFHRLHARRTLLILAAILLAGWLIPPFFHAGRYAKILRAALESRLGRTVELGAVTLRLLPHPGFSIQNVVVEEDPRFGSEPFARVDSVECDLRWRSLWGSRMDCSRIMLDHPVLNLVRDSGGGWNVEDIFHRGSAGSMAVSPAASRRSAAPFDFEAQDAHINFTINGTKRPFALDGVRARFQFNPPQNSVQFSVQCTPLRTDLALLQPPGQVIVTGEWNPAAGPNGPLRARLTTSNSLLYEWIPLIAHRDPGIYGLVSANILFEGSIRKVRISGHMQVNQLHRWDSLPPSPPTPVNFTFSGSWDRVRDQVEIQRADVAFAQSHLRLAGVISQVAQAPDFNLVLAARQTRLQDLLAMGNNLTRHPTGLLASGSVAGRLTLQGPRRAPRYGGSLGVRSLTVRSRHLTAFSSEAEIHIGNQGSARLLPAHFVLGPGIEGVAEGSLFPALPGGKGRAVIRREHRTHRPGHSVNAAIPRYDLVLTLEKIPLHGAIRMARSWGIHGLRDLDATGTGDTSIRLSGGAWPFTTPRLDARGHLDSARLLLAGLNQPVQLTRFRFEIKNGAFVAKPVDAGIGATTFSGWLKHSATREAPWQFNARTPHLSLEQASLWFSVLGYRRPMRILDLIPGLRSLEGRRLASRNLFATLNAQGSFECPAVTFHSLTLRDFHAGVTLSGRVARISEAAFRLASGKGNGSAEVSFKQAPAQIAGQFKMTGLRLQQFPWKFPAALTGIRGLVAAAGHFTTRGLTSREMAAHLEGKAELHLRNVVLGNFDPLEAAAQAASLGSLAPVRTIKPIPALDMSLAAGGSGVHLRSNPILLSGATMSLAGEYSLNGIANLLVHADLTHVNRRWVIDAAPSPSHGRSITLQLTGPLNNLTLTAGPETARFHR